MDQPLLASELYATANGAMCAGNEECHWCSARCTRDYIADDQPPNTIIQGAWGRTHAKRPGNPWMCPGCLLWKRKRVTVPFVGGGFVDGKCAEDFGWWVTDEGSWALAPHSFGVLYDKLLNPPLTFSLSFLAREDSGPPPGVPGSNGKKLANLLQLCVANDLSEIKADTPLAFTLNSVKHTYTVYELETAIRDGADGRDPGVGALLKELGPAPPHVRIAPNRKQGREKISDAYRGRRKIFTSGIVV